MSAQKTTTQAEVDAALEELGIKPTGEFTSDKTQQLYKNSEGRGFMLPASNEGYSYWSASDIIAHIKENSPIGDLIGRHTFVSKPNLRIAKPENKS